MLELDLVLQRFLEHRAREIDDGRLLQLGELLDLPDNDLWDIVAGRSERYDARLGEVVALLRAS